MGDLDFLQIHSLPLSLPPFFHFPSSLPFTWAKVKGKLFGRKARKNQITPWFAKGEDDAESGIRDTRLESLWQRRSNRKNEDEGEGMGKIIGRQFPGQKSKRERGGGAAGVATGQRLRNAARVPLTQTHNFTGRFRDYFNST